MKIVRRINKSIQYKIKDLNTAWYKLYDNLRKKLELDYKSNLNKIEIVLTQKCDVKCHSCDMSCSQAPSDEQMSVEQIKKFIYESITMKKKWEQIRIMGGEPTLHKDIIEICNLLADYKRKFSLKTEVCLLTNGYGPQVEEILEQLPKQIKIINSNKKSAIQEHFYSYNVAPVDLPEFRSRQIRFSRGCQVSELYGIALTRYGYYPSSPSSGIDRVFNMDIGIKSLNKVTRARLKEQLNRLCRYCGHFKQNYEYKDKANEFISKTWEDAYRNYNNSVEKSGLTLY